MDFLLFGLAFPVQGNQVALPPGASWIGEGTPTRHFDGQYIELRGTFYLGHCDLSITIGALLKVVDHQGQLVCAPPPPNRFQLHIREGRHPTPAPLNPGLLLQFACLHLARRPTAPNVESGYTLHCSGTGTERIHLRAYAAESDGQTPCIGGGDLPFHLYPYSNWPSHRDSFLHVDLARGTVSGDAGLLQLDTYNARKGTQGLLRAFFARNRLAHPFTLHSGQKSLSLRFAMGDLALHAEAIEGSDGTRQPLRTPILAQGGELALDFIPGAGADAAPQIRSITLGPASDGTQGRPRLRLGAACDRRNRMLEVECDEPLALALRPASTSRPGSFLLASPFTIRLATSVDALHDASSPAEFAALPGGTPWRVEIDRIELASRHPLLRPELTDRATAARLQWQGGQLQHPLPGRRLAAAADGRIELLHFDLKTACLPLLPAEALALDPPLHALHIGRVNASLVGNSRIVAATRHESALRQELRSDDGRVELLALYPSPAPAAINGATSAQAVASAQPTLAAHRLRRDFGYCQIEHEVPAGGALDYVLLDRALGGWSISGGEGFDVCPRTAGVQKHFVVNLSSATSPHYWGVLKLSREQTLAEILSTVGRELDLSPLDESLRRRDWTGLVLFDLQLDIHGFPLLRDLGGAMGALHLHHLALSPTRNGGPAGIHALLGWNNPAPVPSTPPHPENEAALSLRSLSLRIRDGRLVAFRASAVLDLYGLFGHRHASVPRVDLEGSYDADAQRIRFLGTAREGIALFPPDAAGKGPFKQVTLRAVEAVREGADTLLEVDGEVEMQAVTFDNWHLASEGQRGRFRRLGLLLDGASGWLRVLYRRLRFDFERPPLKLFNSAVFGLRLDSLSVDWRAWPGFPRMYTVYDKLKGSSALALRFGLRLGRLPELFAGAVEGLELDLGLALPMGAPWDLSNFSFAVGIRGFDRLDIDILRFLRLRAKTVTATTEPVDGHQVPILRLDKIRVEVLGKPIVQGIDLLLVANPYTGEPGVLLRYAAQNALGSSFFHVSWFLIGRHIALPTALAQSLIAIDPPDRQGLIDQTQLLRTGPLGDYLPRKRAQGAEQWVFGMGISIFGDFLIGKALFHDRRYYGLSLQGELFRQWFGFDFAISVLYVRRHRPEEDSLITSMRVPAVTIGPVHFQGGVVSLEVQMGGGFLLDMGFPRLLGNGRRDWSRALGAILTPLQASGGMYLGLRALTPPDADTRNQLFEAGWAIQGGLGAAWGGGVFRVWGTVGVYAVMEGRFSLRERKIVAIELVGAVGILIRGVGELNWWVISIRIEVVAAAEARATLTWRERERLKLKLDFILYASASAQACIGSGWFKICRGISVGIDLPYSLTLDIG